MAPEGIGLHNAGAVEEKLALADDDGGVVCREAELFLQINSTLAN